MVCLSLSATTRLLDSLGVDHDEDVCEWRDGLLPRVKQLVQQEVHHNLIIPIA